MEKIWLYRFAAYAKEYSDICVGDTIHINENNYWQGHTDEGVVLNLGNITLFEMTPNVEDVRLTVTSKDLTAEQKTTGGNIEIELAMDRNLISEFDFVIYLQDMNTAVHLFDGVKFEFDANERSSPPPDFIVEGTDWSYDTENRLVIDNRNNSVVLGFGNCVISEGIKVINECAFSNCNELTAIVLPSSLRIIGNAAFANCVNLSSVIIPEGTREIHFAAFHGCKSLHHITLPYTLQFVDKLNPFTYETNNPNKHNSSTS